MSDKIMKAECPKCRRHLETHAFAEEIGEQIRAEPQVEWIGYCDQSGCSHHVDDTVFLVTEIPVDFESCGYSVVETVETIGVTNEDGSFSVRVQR